MTETSTETGGKTPARITPSEFETYLRIAREQKVAAFKVGDLAVQFTPDVPAVVEDTPAKTAGGWKRGPDLDQDPHLDWD